MISKSKALEYGVKEAAMNVDKVAKKEYLLIKKQEVDYEKLLEDKFKELNDGEDSHPEEKDEKKMNILREEIKDIQRAIGMMKETIAYYEFNFGFTSDKL